MRAKRASSLGIDCHIRGAGRVWAVKRRVDHPDGSHQYQHVAVKIMKWSNTDKLHPSATVRIESSDPTREHVRVFRYLKMETVTQALVGDLTANIPEIIEGSRINHMSLSSRTSWPISKRID